MRDRIWYKLIDYVYYSYYLGEYIRVNKKNVRILNAVLITLALGGIAGWYKFAESKIVWASILVIIQAVRILRPQIMISEKELFSISTMQSFYTQKVMELEELWYKFEDGKISEQQAQKVLSRINTEETMSIKLNKHDKVPKKKRIDSFAEEETNNYIKRK